MYWKLFFTVKLFRAAVITRWHSNADIMPSTGYIYINTLEAAFPLQVLQASSDLRESRFSRFVFKFQISISILSNFYFTFTSRSWFPVIFISLSFLEKSERDKNFTLFLEKKRVKFYTKFHEKFNHSSIEGEEPKTNYVRNNEWRYPTVHSRYDNK